VTKRGIAVCLLFAVLFLSIQEAYGQERRKSPPGRRRATSGNYTFSGAGGGFLFFGTSLDLSPINPDVEKMGISPMKENLIGEGGYGFAYFSKYMKLGGMGGGGTVSSSGEVDGVEKGVDFSFSFGGPLIEFSTTVAKRLELFAGGAVLFGSVSVSLSREDAPLVWDDVWDYYQTGGTLLPYSTTELTCSYWGPYIYGGTRINILRWFAVGGQVGFLKGFMEDNWEIGELKLNNGPEYKLENLLWQVHFTFGG